MAKEVILPKFGFTQEVAQIVRWLKQPGERVEQGDPIAEVTTDKVNMEVEAPASGILDGVLYQEGETVPVAEVIAFIRRPDEALPEKGRRTEDEGPTPGAVPASTAATPVAARLAEAQGVDLGAVSGTGPGGRITRRDVEAYLKAPPGEGGKVRAVPAARRLARELNVDLEAVAGSGPRGRVQSADVQAAAQRPTTDDRRQAAVEPGAAVVRGRSSTVKKIPLAGMRRTIATRLQKSFQESPHIFFDAYIDVTGAEALRARLNQRLPQDQPRISLTALIVKACAWALGRHPLLNSRIEADEIVLLEEINVGVAVALEAADLGGGGLIVPVVKDAPRKGLAGLAAEIADLAERARSGRLRPDDVMDGTFTVSNLGMFGVDRFTAILNPPQVGILAVSRVRREFVPDAHDQPVARPILTVTLSADHRVVDGAVAARFLADLRAGLEEPGLLLA